MKKTSKKLIGVFMVVMLVATIGAIFASAETDDTEEDDGQDSSINGYESRGHGCLGFGIHFLNLTEEQKTEIDELRETMEDEGATSEEIRNAIMNKIDEFGVLDERLQKEINQTEQRLDILYRKQELRDEGYNWDEIKDIIQEEFDLDSANDLNHEMKNRGGFHGRCRNHPDGFDPNID